MCHMATPTTPIQAEAPPPETPVTRADRPRVGGAVAVSLVGGLVAALLFVLLVVGPQRFTAPEPAVVGAALRGFGVGGGLLWLLSRRTEQPQRWRWCRRRRWPSWAPPSWCSLRAATSWTCWRGCGHRC